MADVYNELTWDRSKFRAQSSVRREDIQLTFLSGNWANQENCREFFTGYAERKGFDPLVPENWYHVRRQDIINANVRVPIAHDLR